MFHISPVFKMSTQYNYVGLFLHDFYIYFSAGDVMSKYLAMLTDKLALSTLSLNTPITNSC